MTNNFDFYVLLLNQACAWFLKIDPVGIVGMRIRVCMCVCPTSGMIWRDMNLIRLIKKVQQLLYGNLYAYRDI